MRVVTTCPPIREYSADFQKRLADEVEALPPGTAIEEALTDYHDLRNQLRACQ